MNKIDAPKWLNKSAAVVVRLLVSAGIAGISLGPVVAANADGCGVGDNGAAILNPTKLDNGDVFMTVRADMTSDGNMTIDTLVDCMSKAWGGQVDKEQLREVLLAKYGSLFEGEHLKPQLDNLSLAISSGSGSNLNFVGVDGQQVNAVPYANLNLSGTGQTITVTKRWYENPFVWTICGVAALALAGVGVAMGRRRRPMVVPENLE